MNGYWNSLRPMEKRLVVGVGTMVVILLNLWFVVPHFSDLPKVQERKAKAQRTLEMFQKEIDQNQNTSDGSPNCRAQAKTSPGKIRSTSFKIRSNLKSFEPVSRSRIRSNRIARPINFSSTKSKASIFKPRSSSLSTFSLAWVTDLPSVCAI